MVDIATAQHNEYHLSFEHFIVASELEFHRHLNFAFLTVWVISLLLPLGYLLWLTYGNDGSGLNRRLLAFVPISLCFFSLTYWENLNWAMTGLQNTPVILFSLLAIYLVAPTKALSHAQLLLGCLAAALAAFSSANGFLLGPVGLLILCLGAPLPRPWRGALASFSSSHLRLSLRSSGSVNASIHLHTRPLFFLAFLGGVIPLPSTRGFAGYWCY